MAFNHYAKIKNILQTQPAGWYIKHIKQPTATKSFNGDLRQYDSYYRIYDVDDRPIKYCKFQQLERLAKTLRISAEDLVIIED